MSNEINYRDEAVKLFREIRNAENPNTTCTTCDCIITTLGKWHIKKLIEELEGLCKTYTLWNPLVLDVEKRVTHYRNILTELEKM